MTEQTAIIYRRNNGQWGSSCDGTPDTGHHIVERNGLYTVYSCDDGDEVIAVAVSRHAAEAAIARDWRSATR